MGALITLDSTIAMCRAGFRDDDRNVDFLTNDIAAATNFVVEVRPLCPATALRSSNPVEVYVQMVGDATLEQITVMPSASATHPKFQFTLGNGISVEREGALHKLQIKAYGNEDELLSEHRRRRELTVGADIMTVYYRRAGTCTTSSTTSTSTSTTSTTTSTTSTTSTTTSMPTTTTVPPTSTMMAKPVHAKAKV